ncbi:MAG: PGF-CTERM sorting domain-containing protein [Methanomicrobiales archaeon HGW-Methanomicrobiales-1]|nr:MAG: PGF-CTERM sorting domain-containing protein [Methanomicrobiales archaeon HGW-Methanomicrobiales-1]
MTKRLSIALVAVALLFILAVVMPVSAAPYATRTNITQGATVFIGEQGLNLSAVVNNGVYYTPTNTSVLAPAADGAAAQIGWWASAAQLTTTSPTKSLSLVGRSGSFTVEPSDFGAYAGNWYLINTSTGYANTPAAFVAADPSIDIQVWDFTNGVTNNNFDVTGKSIPQGDYLGFKINTNQYVALANNRWSANQSAWANGIPTGAATDFPWVQYNNALEGYIDINFKDASGSTLTALLNQSKLANTIVKLNVSTQPYTWGGAYQAIGGVPSNWSTDATDVNGQYAYPPGTYSISATSKLNAMNDNYKNAGADYTGKTVSQVVTVTLVSDTIKIEANKDSVVRSKPFSVTVTGKPNTIYHFWVKGTSTMSGAYDSQPPMVKANQLGVTQDKYTNAATPVYYLGTQDVGAYLYENGNNQVIWQDVASGSNDANKALLGNGTYVYGNVTLSTSGTRTIEFTTNNWTKAQKYTIRVENLFGTQYKSDEVDVKVEKGAVTIVAAGDQSYYLGEEIKFSGTNTESYKTYLFIMGPNLKPSGSKIDSSNPRTVPVATNDLNTFKIVDVNGDNTWSWKWGTSAVALDAGTYTIYAVSQPKQYDSAALAEAAFGTVSIIIKKPFVSATASQSTVAQGDKVFITGTAEGNPSGVKIWILGKNYPTTPGQVQDESVNADATFSYEVTQAATKTLYPGQYFVVVQHPMQNNVFDVKPVEDTASGKTYVRNMQLNGVGLTTGTNVFTLLGAGSLQGSDAAEALVQGINDPNVDDTYTKLQFLVEVPVIRIDPVGDKHVGDKFTITAATNLAVDDEILVQVYSSSFKPTQKSQSGEFSGATGTVKVAKGDSGMNKISFDVDSSTFKPDEYIVTADAILQTATGTALFNVLEGAAPVVTTTAPVMTTAVPTAVPTTVATAVPTPIPTTKSPGYGALIALIGLGAVAFIVVRRH